ncbi:MAG: alpha/beta hydrolase [Albidovulum sp.]
MSSGHHPISEIKELTQSIASCGYRVIAHDRRNCGRSSLSFHSHEHEDEVSAEDLLALLVSLDVKRAFVVGKSRSARVALRFALHYPDMTQGVALWGLSGGAFADKFLNDYYFGQYLRACEMGGMEAVCALDHFAVVIAERPANRDALMAMGVQQFISTMDRWRAQFLATSDQPIFGFNDAELGGIRVPTAIVPYYDRLHPRASAVHALKTIPGSRLFDFDPSRHHSPSMSAANISDDTAAVAAILCNFFQSHRRSRKGTDFLGNLWRKLCVLC